MRRTPLTASVAALALLLAGGQASAARVLTPVRGEVRALAFSGDAVIVARQAPGDALVVERLVAGEGRAQKDQRGHTGDEDAVSLAASADALAVGLNPESDEVAPSRVMVGAPLGPLREVATCDAGLIVRRTAIPGACSRSRPEPPSGAPSRSATA